MRSAAWRILLPALVLGCTPAVTKDPSRQTSAATIALFAPDPLDACLSVLPFPTDLAKNPVTGRLDIPYCRTDSADQVSLKAKLRELDGFALGSVPSTRFSGPLDPASLGAAVKLIAIDSGVEVPIKVRTVGAGDSLEILPISPLKESTRYAAAVSTDARDREGRPVVSDKVFVFAKSTEPLIDADGFSRFLPLGDADANALEPLRQGLAPMFDALEGQGFPRERIAVAWSFTTQSAHSMLVALAAKAAASPAEVFHENVVAAAAHPLILAANIPHASLCDVHTGRVKVKSVLSKSGSLTLDTEGAPVLSDVSVDFVLTTPRGADGCTKPWAGDKVVVFAHGLGRCKNDMLALAYLFGSQGFATLSLDGPYAGARTAAQLGDQDLDGCPDQGATPELIALPGQANDPFAVRDRLIEWSLELVQASKALEARSLQFAGLDGGGQGASWIGMVGHSWGGIAAGLAASLDAPLDAVVINAGSAELGAVFAPSIEAEMARQLEAAGTDPSAEPGRTLLRQQADQAVAAFRWAMEPGDPLHAAHAIKEQLPVLVQVVSASRANADAPLHATGTQEKLASALGRVEAGLTTLDMTVNGGKTPLCDSPLSTVGALLMPCIKRAAAPNFATALLKTMGLQRQLVTFLGTAAAGTPKVCDIDFSVACQ